MAIVRKSFCHKQVGRDKKTRTLLNLNESPRRGNTGRPAGWQFKEWADCRAQAAGYEVLAAQAGSEQHRPYFLWLAKWFIDEHRRLGVFPNPELFEGLVPPKGAEVSHERALEIYLLQWQRGRERSLRRCRELEEALSLSEFQQETVVNGIRVSRLLMIYDTYVRTMLSLGSPPPLNLPSS
jgi:hypothetical protein